MANPPPDAIAQCEIDLNDLDRALLELLDETDARVTPRVCKQQLETDAGRSWISRRLSKLAEHGLVERVDRGLYELPGDCREW